MTNVSIMNEMHNRACSNTDLADLDAVSAVSFVRPHSGSFRKFCWIYKAFFSLPGTMPRQVWLVWPAHSWWDQRRRKDQKAYQTNPSRVLFLSVSRGGDSPSIPEKNVISVRYHPLRAAFDIMELSFLILSGSYINIVGNNYPIPKEFTPCLTFG